MRLICYQTSERRGIAVDRDGTFADLSQADASLPNSIKELFAAGTSLSDRLDSACRRAQPLPNDFRLLPPVPDPEKIICVGLNYADHAAETGAEIPAEPVIFNKFPTALRAHGEPIELPAASNQVDYEAELVVVIGTAGKNIPQEDALSYVSGYTCGHDVSARDWQKNKPQRQWLLGKSFDSFAPLGPAIVTADQVADPHDLDIALRLNGQTMQQSNTRQLIFRIDRLIAYLSQVCTLRPGDLIFTGTPPGVGFARKPPVFLKPGDQVEIEIEGIGVLKNPVVAGT